MRTGIGVGLGAVAAAGAAAAGAEAAGAEEDGAGVAGLAQAPSASAPRTTASQSHQRETTAAPPWRPPIQAGGEYREPGMGRASNQSGRGYRTVAAPGMKKPRGIV